MYKKNLRTGAIFAGCVFLCNPSVISADILPDIIGIILIMYGLSMLRDLSPGMENAYYAFRPVLFVELGKLASNLLFLIFDGTWHLIFSFVFGVLELIFMLPAFSKLSDGAGKLIASVGKDGGEIKFPYALTACFIAVRAACDIIPQLSVLTSRYGDVGSAYDTPDTAPNIFVIAACVCVSLTLGIIWLVGIKKYTDGLAANTEKMSMLEKRYSDEVMTNAELIGKRSRDVFFTCVVAASATLVCIETDSFYIVPDFLFGLLMILACSKQKKLFDDYRAFIKKCIAFSATGFAVYVLHAVYAGVLAGYSYPTERKEFLIIFIPCAALSVTQYALFAFIVKDMRKALDRLIVNELSFSASSATANGARYGFEMMRKTKSGLMLKTKRLYVKYLIFTLTALISRLTFPFLDMIWALSFVAGIWVLISAYSVCENVASEIKVKLY